MKYIGEQFAQDTILELHELIKLADDKAERNANALRLRQIFERLAKESTKDSGIAFADLFTRYSFIAERFAVPDDLDAGLHYVRRMANRAVHKKEFEFQKAAYTDIVLILAQFTSFLSEFPLPDLLNKPLSKKYVKNPQELPTETTEVPQKRVLYKSHSKKMNNGVELVTLTGINEETGGPFILTHINTPEHNVTDTLVMLKEFRQILFHKLRMDKDGNYYTGPDSLMVIEPDYLVDVSSIAECYNMRGENYQLFFLKMLQQQGTKKAMFKGTVANGLLDALTINPDRDPDEILDDIFNENALQAALLGDEGINEIRSEIKNAHFKNITTLLEELGEYEILVEPTFISPYHGLQGRLDIYLSKNNSPLEKEVIEMKSGSSPNGTAVWNNNQQQAFMYMLLIKSALGEETKVKAYIFYSRAENAPRRFVVPNPSTAGRQLFNRNAIVAVLYAISEGRFTIFKNLAKPEFLNAVQFEKNELSHFLRNYEALTETEREYYHAYLSFLIRELITAKTGGGTGERGGSGFSSLWNETVPEKKNRYAIITDLKLLSFDPETSELQFSYNSNQMHNFRAGDVALIYNGEKLPAQQQILKGYFVSFDDTKIVFRLRNKQLPSGFFTADTLWNLEHDLFESGSWSEIASLSQFVFAGEQYRSLITGAAVPEYDDIEFEPHPDLNDNQNLLLKNAIAAKDYFLLQGPPGTGKTSRMLPAILSELISRTEENIYILSFTNRSVDEIVNRLRENNFDFIRVGSASVDDDEMIHNIAKGKTPSELHTFIRSKRIVVSTVSSFHIKGADMMTIKGRDAKNKAGICVVDESSQLTEPALVGLLHNFSKWILIGDQNQLPAVVAQESMLCKVESPLLKKIGVKNLTISLFERLYRLAEQRDNNFACGMLEQHYRMHGEIASLINEYYGNKLRTGREGQETDHNPETDIVLPFGKRVVFIPTNIAGNSNTNRQEAGRVADCIEYLVKKNGGALDESAVGIVTPWRAQIALINSELSRRNLPPGLPVTVDTVERFQGSEKKIILISFSLNYKSQINMVEAKDADGEVDRKLIVALSRAKEQLVIFGNPEILAASEGYKKLLEKVQNNGGTVQWDKVTF